MGAINLDASGAIATITLNRPPVNAIDEAFVEELHRVLDIVGADGRLRVLAIKSGASKAFSVGADIKMMRAIRDAGDSGRMSAFIVELQRAYARLENLAIPTVAVVSGHALGGGFELALSCDFRFVTSDEALLGLPEVELGMLPGGGGCVRLTRLAGEAKAKELIYLGHKLDAPAAVGLGLALGGAADVASAKEVDAFIAELAAKPTVAIAGIKKAVQLAGRAGLEAGNLSEVVESVKIFSSRDAAEGFAAFLGRRKPQFLGN